MSGVWIRIAQEVGEAHGREGIVVAERVFIELHHSSGAAGLILVVS